jgi:hypothetical protein
MIRLLFKLLDRKYNFLNRDIDKEKVDDWLFRMSEDKGFRDYFKLRDYVLLKTMGQGQKDVDYWINVGARRELLFLLGKADEQRRLRESKKKGGEDDAIQE